ncbi:Teichoic acids export ATP-binding protein TagH [compost metagenome]
MTNNEDVVIKAENLSKAYKLYNKPADRVKEVVSFSLKSYHTEFKALKGVSFQVGKGECLGIIGKNGSGKSTLLKMITGVLTPSSGTLSINGKISALLELGAGFNPDFTGLENVYLNGTIMGLTKEQVNDRLQDILDFADIGEFINQPVKSYSSGMFVRLAFSVAINTDPEILIIDEALSVGDLRFQQKCYRKIDEMKKTKTVLFVTHDLSVINKYCDRVLWINEGELIDEGDPKTISKKYQAFMLGAELKTVNFESLSEADNVGSSSSISRSVDALSSELEVMGDEKALITGISLIDIKTDQKLMIVESDEELRLLIRVNVNQVIYNPIVGFSIKDRLGNIITQTNSYVLGIRPEKIQPGNDYVFSFDFNFPSLNKGQYTVSPAFASGTQEDHKQHSWVHDALIIQVLPIGYEELNGVIYLQDVTFSALA